MNSVESSSTNIVRGIICIVFSAFSFAVMGVFVRLSGELPLMQKAFFRNFVAFLIALIILLRNRKNISVPKGAWKYLLLRSASGSLGIFGNFYAVDRIPIADAGILNKMSPFFAVIFSFILLGEKIKPFPLVCVIMAFVGSVFIVKPSAQIINSFPAIVGFIGGMGAGFAYSCVRKLGEMKCTGAFIVLFFSLFSTLISIPFLITGAVPMSSSQWMLLIGTGIAAAGGQFGITFAYYNAPAREISVYDYSQIIFSAALGYVFFQQIPDVLSITGYVIIVLMAVLVFIYNKQEYKKLNH